MSASFPPAPPPLLPLRGNRIQSIGDSKTQVCQRSSIGFPALFTTTESGGSINGVTIASPGSLVTAVSSVTLSGGGGTGGGITVTGYAITNAGIVNPGLGYQAGDVLVPPGGTYSAQGAITVGTVNSAGQVLAISISTAGTYSVLPTNNLVTPTGGHGSGCQIVLYYGVSAATYTAGSGYSSGPTGTSVGGYTSGTTVFTSRSLQHPITWAESLLACGINFDLDAVPGAVGNWAAPGGSCIGLATLPGYAGTGATYATATVGGATGFAASGIISNGQVVGWTVTGWHTAGAVTSTTYSNVSITTDSSTPVYATTIIAGLGTWALAGQNLLEMAARLPLMLSGTYETAIPDIVHIQGGDNDLSTTGALQGWTGSNTTITGFVLAQRMMTLVQMVVGANKLCVVQAMGPNTNAYLSGIGLSTGQITTWKAVCSDYDYWMTQAAAGDTSINPNRLQFAYINNWLRRYTDGSTNNWDPKPYNTVDGCHPAQNGAKEQGYDIAAYFASTYNIRANDAPAPYRAYNATYNTKGNRLAQWNNGTSSGSSGNVTATYPSSNGWGMPVWASYTSLPGAGTVTVSTLAGTPAAPDLDGSTTPGIMWVFAVPGVSGTTNNNKCEFFEQSSNYALSTLALTVGQEYEFRVDLEWSGVGNIYYPIMQMQDRQNSGILSQTGASYVCYWPMSNDQILPSMGINGPFGVPFTMRCGPFTVNAASTNTAVALGVYADVSATPNGAGAGGPSSGITGTFIWRNPRIFTTADPVG